MKNPVRVSESDVSQWHLLMKIYTVCIQKAPGKT